MSSLNAARADNFYFPPEWEPKHGSISKFQGSKGANQYEQFGIIRFELPYNSWCLKCEAHIGKGTRYNAKKEKAGKYYTTQIWEFHMKCHLCDHKFIIRTDPKNTDYEFVEGIRKKETITAEDAVASGTQVIDDDLTIKPQDTDAIAKLEFKEDDKRKAQSQATQLRRLKEMQDSRSYYDFELNSALRKQMRAKKRKLASEEKESRDKGLGIKLLAPTETDRSTAKQINFKSSGFRKTEKERLAAIRSSSIFGNNGSSISQRLADLHSKKQKSGINARHFKIIGRTESSRTNSVNIKVSGLGKKKAKII